MIDLGYFESCVCVRRGDPSDSCGEKLVLQEKGKKVIIRPRHQESAKLLILDGCVFRDDFPKCDGMFFYEKGNKLIMILVEIKGDDIVGDRTTLVQLTELIKKHLVVYDHSIFDVEIVHGRTVRGLFHIPSPL